MQDRVYGFHKCEENVYMVAIVREPGPDDTEKLHGRSETGLLSLLRLMYDTYVLFHGLIGKALEVPSVSGQWEGLKCF